MPRELRVKVEDGELSRLIRSAVVKGVQRRDAGGKHYVRHHACLLVDT